MDKDLSTDNKASVRTVDFRREIQSLKDAVDQLGVSKLPPAPHHSRQKSQQEIANLSELTKFRRPGPDLYQALLKSAPSDRPLVKIPETLLYVPSCLHPIFLSNDSSGHIAVDSSENSMAHFFEAVEKKTKQAPALFPKYIHISFKKAPTLAFHKKEARKVFEECPSYSHWLQRYIIPQTNHASKLRYHWIHNKPAKSYIITNTAKVTVIPCNNKTDNGSRHSVDLGLDPRPAFAKQFIVNYRKPKSCNVITSYQQNPALVKIVSTLRQLISSHARDKAVGIEELVVDCIKDSSKEWVLLACKGHRLRGDKPRSDSSKKPLLFENSFANTPQFKLEIKKSRKKTHIVRVLRTQIKHVINKRACEQSLNDFRTRIESQSRSMSTCLKPLDMDEIHQKLAADYLAFKSSDHLGRVPANMIKLVPHKSKKKLITEIDHSRQPVIVPTRHKERLKDALWAGNPKVPPGRHIELASKQLDDVAKVLDRKVKAAEDCRRDLLRKKRLTELLSQVPGVEAAIHRAGSYLPWNHTLCTYFEHKGSHEVKRIMGGVYRCLNPQTNLGSRLLLKQIHSQMGITEKEFDTFIDVVYEQITREVPDEEDRKIILENLVYFKDSIVDPALYN